MKKRTDKAKGPSGPIDVDAEGRKAMERLEAIAMYMTDFHDIVDDQSQKRSAANQQQSGLAGFAEGNVAP